MNWSFDLYCSNVIALMTETPFLSYFSNAIAKLTSCADFHSFAIVDFLAYF